MKNTFFTKRDGDWGYTTLGHLSFLILLIASVYYFKERILYADSAFYLFKCINFEKINVEAYRYGATLPQIPVLLAMKFGASLKSLIMIFSAAFIALYYIIFLLCTKLLKNTAAGLSIIFTLIMCISESFFFPVTETQQSLIYAVLLFAVLQYPSFRNSWVKILLASLVITMSFLAHPVALYPVAFIIGYSAIEKKQLRSIMPYLLMAFIIGMAVLKIMLTDENSYEGNLFSEFLKSPSVILDLPNFYSTNWFLKRIFGLYLGIMIFELILIIYFILKKEYLKLAWQLGFSLFFLAISLLTYNKGYSDMLMERAFMPFALLTSIPLLNELIENDKRYNAIKLTFLSLIIIFSFNTIYIQGKVFRDRTRFNVEVLTKTAKLPNRKFIVESSELQKHHYIGWSYAFETLMLSSITDNMPVQTIFPANNVGEVTKYTQFNDVFLGCDFWMEWSIDQLNHKYYKLSKELPYAVVKVDDL